MSNPSTSSRARRGSLGGRAGGLSSHSPPLLRCRAPLWSVSSSYIGQGVGLSGTERPESAQGCYDRLIFSKASGSQSPNFTDLWNSVFFQHGRESANGTGHSTSIFNGSYEPYVHCDNHQIMLIPVQMNTQTGEKSLMSPPPPGFLTDVRRLLQETSSEAESRKCKTQGNGNEAYSYSKRPLCR